MTTQGSTLARYKVLHEVARGAMGVVYAARDQATGAVVALKTIDPELLKKSDGKLAGRLLKHARENRLLSHRNIVKVHDAGEALGTVYVVMEMLEGESLRKILDSGPLPLARSIQLVRDIAGGLAYAHLQGVVHGCLKPSNIIVSPSGLVKITDFGIGQAVPVPGARSEGLRYRCPEQLRGDPVDHRCDIFSLGAILYEMLTGRAPFAGDSASEVLGNILHGKLQAPSELNQHVPRVVDGIVSNMLAAQPVSRLPGIPILLRDLQHLEEALGLGSGATPASQEPAASVTPAEPRPSARKPDPPPSPDPAPSKSRIPADAPRARRTDGDAFDYQKAMALMERESRRERSSGKRPAVFATLAVVLAVAGLGVAGFMYYSPSPSHRIIAADPAPVQQTPATTAAVPQSLTVSSAPSPMPPEPPAAEPDSRAHAESLVARAPEQEPPTKTASAPQASPPPAVSDEQAEREPLDAAPVQTAVPPKRLAAEPKAVERAESPRATQPAAKVSEEQPRGTARLVLAVSPRGEVYINGKHYGTTPPVTTVELDPGIYRIEVRSGSRKPYLTYMTVQAGDVRRVRHQFNVTP